MKQIKSEKNTQRIAKWLARAGVASRRGAEQLIAEGKVSINGKTLTSPALNVRGDEDIRVDGRRIGEPEPPRLWRLYKQKGLITTTSDPEGRPSVFSKLPEELPRVMSVGRLDINTEGLLLLTNDGELARQMELPATGWTRRYRVRAFGSITQEQLDELAKGITVDGVRYGGISARLEKQQRGNVWLNMVLREGKTREIKNVLSAFDLKVNRLIRVSFGPFTLHGLEPGDVKEVPRKILRDQLGSEWEGRLKPPRSSGKKQDEMKPGAKSRKERPSGRKPPRAVNSGQKTARNRSAGKKDHHNENRRRKG